MIHLQYVSSTCQYSQINMTHIFEGSSFPRHRFCEMTENHPLCHVTGEISSVTALQGVVNTCIRRIEKGEDWSLVWIHFILAGKAEIATPSTCQSISHVGTSQITENAFFPPSFLYLFMPSSCREREMGEDCGSFL